MLLSTRFEKRAASVTETARGDREMRLKKLILIFAALATVFVLAACGGPSEQPTGDQGNKSKQEEKQQAPQKTPDKQEAPKQDASKQDAKKSSVNLAALEPPRDEMLKLTVPKMKRINNDLIPTGVGTDEVLFHDYSGVHLKATGFPWEEGANVYIAGHRLGFPGTKSNLAFDDLNKLEAGDEFYITDSEGRKYTYEVFRKFVAAPNNVSVLAPVDGKNIATLQTCTKPDYVDRLVVRGELKDVEKA
jgi:sortase A